MRQLRFISPVVMLLSLAVFTGVVFADSSPVDPNADPQGALSQFWTAVTSHKWGIASVIGTMLLVALVRFIAPRLHDRFGAWVLTTRVSASLALISGMLSAVATKLMSGSPWSMSIVAYGFAAGVGAIGGYNAFWDLIFPNDKGKSAATKMSIPPVSMLLPIAFLLALPGCPKPMPNPNGPNASQQYDTAFGKCMEQKGLHVAANDGVAIWQILDDPTTDQNQKVKALEALGITTAAGALTDLATCALYAWDQINPMLPNKNPTPAQAARRVFLSRHASAPTTAESH